MAQVDSRQHDFFELGQLYYDRGDFFLAIEKFQGALRHSLEKQNKEQAIQCINRLLRLYSETEQYEKIHEIKEKLQDLVLQGILELDARTYYSLALCACFKEQLETSLEYLNRSLQLALTQNRKTDLCYAINGFALVYRRMGRFDEALKEIEKLEVFLSVLDIPEVKISSRLILSQILVARSEYEKALSVLWEAYEAIRFQKTVQMHIYLLYYIGLVYAKSGEKDLARIYFNLASKSVDSKNMTRLARNIEEDLAALGSEASEKFDLVFDLRNHSVVERRLGRVDFRNQFILLDLLKLFVQNQGQVYSKEFLVENVWKQAYDPGVHDNKVYVTIKRLRKLIEPDFDRPKYIFRAKNGYFMNKTVRVLVDRVEGE